MDYTTLFPESQEGQEQPAKRMQSLYEVCQQVVDGRCARGKRYDLAGLLVVLVLAKLAGMQSLLGESRLDPGSASEALQGVAVVVETHAMCQYVQLCAGTSGQSTGQCRPGRLVRAPGGRKPLWRGTQPFSGTAKPTARPSGRGWQSLERYWQAAVWGRGAAEAGATCV
jgi:hypothetical protein